MNFLERSMDWFKRQREAHTTVEVLIGITKDTATPINCTITKSEANSITRGVVVHSIYYHFIFDTSDLVSKGLQINRNLNIWYGNNQYQITQEGRDMIEHNDPFQKDTILTGVLKNNVISTHS